MVNHGTSAACQTCKKRKVKVRNLILTIAFELMRRYQCDEKRPGCLRCLKIGKYCPGYPDEWDLAFRSQNEAVKEKVSSQQLAQSQQRSSDKISRSDLQDERRSPLSKAVIQSSDMLPDDLHQHAICLFFQDYIIESCGRCPGYLNFLPELYGRAAESSLLTVAVLAASYANIAQKLDRHDITIKAMSNYRKALRQVSTVLSEKRESTSDMTMTSIMLLGLYEVNMGIQRDDYKRLMKLFEVHKYYNIGS